MSQLTSGARTDAPIAEPFDHATHELARAADAVGRKVIKSKSQLP